MRLVQGQVWPELASVAQQHARTYEKAKCFHDLDPAKEDCDRRVLVLASGNLRRNFGVCYINLMAVHQRYLSYVLLTIGATLAAMYVFNLKSVNGVAAVVAFVLAVIFGYLTLALFVSL